MNKETSLPNIFGSTASDLVSWELGCTIALHIIMNKERRKKIYLLFLTSGSSLISLVSVNAYINHHLKSHVCQFPCKHDEVGINHTFSNISNSKKF